MTMRMDVFMRATLPRPGIAGKNQPRLNHGMTQYPLAV